MGSKTIFVVAAGVLTLGCTSAYAPRPGPRVAIILQNGAPAYVRDGITFEGGVFGGDIEEAVSGNPEAEEAARSYKNTLVAGFCTVLGGSLAFGTGAGLTIAGAANHNDAGDKQAMLGSAVMLSGLAAYVVGVVLTASAQPKLYDVVNVYNDGVDARLLPATPLALATPPAPAVPLAPPAPATPLAPPPPAPPAAP